MVLVVLHITISINTTWELHPIPTTTYTYDISNTEVQAHLGLLSDEAGKRNETLGASQW